MNYENIIIEQEGRIAIITVNRPKKLNALNKATLRELNHALKTLEKQKNVRAIILTGSGDKAFVAGADIAEFADFSVAEGAQLSREGHELVFDFIANFPIPVIAAINGFALGGGLELAMACHFRIASDNARMGLPEVSLGVIPGYGGTQRLPQLVGKGRAMEMIMTGGMIDTEVALSAGLINHMVAQEELIPFCKKIAGKIINNSPAAIARAIRTVNAGFSAGVNGYAAEISAFGACFGTADFKEGTTAFLEKRKAEFTGE
ncbi:MAG: enoyl-CoA hydratase/isomerase family protein [Sinomicrobium sp.]|nr:enoyl-CoA hydratase/isomerase family protein [Sinomicrobium sp.]